MRTPLWFLEWWEHHAEPVDELCFLLLFKEDVRLMRNAALHTCREKAENRSTPRLRRCLSPAYHQDRGRRLGCTRCSRGNTVSTGAPDRMGCRGARRGRCRRYRNALQIAPLGVKINAEMAVSGIGVRVLPGRAFSYSFFRRLRARPSWRTVCRTAGWPQERRASWRD